MALACVVVHSANAHPWVSTRHSCALEWSARAYKVVVGDFQGIGSSELIESLLHQVADIVRAELHLWFRRKKSLIRLGASAEKIGWLIASKRTLATSFFSVVDGRETPILRFGQLSCKRPHGESVYGRGVPLRFFALGGGALTTFMNF
jgi:hypothetical protein